MKTNSLTTSLLMAGLLAIPVPGAMAAILGEVAAVSAIGEPFRMEVRTEMRQPARIGECVRVVPGGTAMDGIPNVDRARVGVVGRGDGLRIVVSQSAPLFEPIVRITLEETCTSRLQREYTLLLPYPGEVATPAAAEPAPQAAPPARSARRTARSSGTGRTWISAPGESAQSLAQALYPDDPATRQRFLAGLRRENPELLGQGASTSRPFPPGTELAMPDLERLSATAAPTPARAARQAEPAPERAARRDPPPVRSDRLVLAEDEPGSARGAPAGAADDERAREERLVAAIDRSINTQLELLERIRRLEEIQAALTAQVAAVDGQIAAASSSPPAGSARPAIEGRTPEAPPASPPASSSRSGWTYVALFAALAAALAFVLPRLRPRRSEPEPTLPAPGPENAQPATVWPLTESGTLAAPKTQGIMTSVPEPSLSSLDWDLSPGARPPGKVAPIVLEEESAEEHESAIELAEIMMGFGRVHGAAETLAEFIHANPKQAVTPWLKLLEVYRAAGLRPEFDGLARQLNKTFNVKAVTWETFDEARTASYTIEQMPHAIETIQKLWGTRDCQAYLQRLLRDNRDGTRQGFPLAVIDEILLLSTILDIELGPYRAEDAGSGEPTEPAPERTL